MRRLVRRAGVSAGDSADRARQLRDAFKEAVDEATLLHRQIKDGSFEAEVRVRVISSKPELEEPSLLDAC